MELKTTHYPRKVFDGQEDLNLVVGDSIKIETSLVAGGGDEILNYTVPAGRTAKIWCRVTIEEID